MLGPIFRMFGSAVYALNTVATAYLIGQISWVGYKKWRAIQKEKMTAAEVRESFVKAYQEDNGEEPSEDLIKTVLDAHNTTEFPIRKRIGDSIEKCKKMVIGDKTEDSPA